MKSMIEKAIGTDVNNENLGQVENIVNILQKGRRGCQNI